LNLIRHGIFDFSTVALLILDECHHCIGDKHPYRHICDIYRNAPNRDEVRIMGLTASAVANKMPPSRLVLF
jgi:ERCC4-related helicase